MKWRRWIKLCLVMVIAICVNTACAKSKEMNYQDYLDLGQKYLAEANYEQAIVAFSKVLELEPKALKAYGGLASAYINTENYEKAQDVLRNGIAVYESLEESEQTDAFKKIYEELLKLKEEIAGIFSGIEAEVEESSAEIEKQSEMPSVDASLYNGSMVVEMYGGTGEYLGRDVYTYDEKGRMTTITWHDVDETVIEHYEFTYDDQQQRTYVQRQEEYYEGIETETDIVNGAIFTGDNGQKWWGGQEQLEGCEDQGWYYDTISVDNEDESEYNDILTDPTQSISGGKVEMENGYYATYQYDSLGRVSEIDTYTTDGKKIGHCVVSYSL